MVNVEKLKGLLKRAKLLLLRVLQSRENRFGSVQIRRKTQKLTPVQFSVSSHHHLKPFKVINRVEREVVMVNA